MNNWRYILNGHEPVVEPDIEKWAIWMRDNNAAMRVKLTHVTEEIDVSTVFLGLAFNLNPDSPAVFETMIFGGNRHLDMERYPTWDEAVAGHDRLVEEMKNEQLGPRK